MATVFASSACQGMPVMHAYSMCCQCRKVLGQYSRQQAVQCTATYVQFMHGCNAFLLGLQQAKCTG